MNSIEKMSIETHVVGIDGYTRPVQLDDGQLLLDGNCIKTIQSPATLTIIEQCIARPNEFISLGSLTNPQRIGLGSTRSSINKIFIQKPKVQVAPFENETVGRVTATRFSTNPEGVVVNGTIQDFRTETRVHNEENQLIRREIVDIVKNAPGAVQVGYLQEILAGRDYKTDKDRFLLNLKAAIELQHSTVGNGTIRPTELPDGRIVFGWKKVDRR